MSTYDHTQAHEFQDYTAKKMGIESFYFVSE